MGNLPISGDYPGCFDGAWSVEREEFPSWEFMKKFLNHGMVFLDIGCQKGIYSKAVLDQIDRSSKIYGFDVVQFPEIKTLEEKYSNFQFIHSGIGDGNPANCKICYDKNIYFQTDKTLSIDEWAKNKDIKKVDFLKIDVDGLELSVLRGAENTLRANNPVLMIEIEGDTTDVFRFLSNLGYTNIKVKNDINYFFKRL